LTKIKLSFNVNAHHQIEYTLKGYRFDCTHTVAFAQKNSIVCLFSSILLPDGFLAMLAWLLACLVGDI